MIQEIHIRDLGVIREAKLEFGRGLNVLTGETGAGKTMVLTALGLLMGERADSAMIRAGSSQITVQGRLNASKQAVIDRVVDAGGLIEDGELLISRVVTGDKSRAILGGSSVPAGVLGEVGSHLVVVHGQSDQIRLKSASAQREALDAFAGVQTLLSDYRIEFNAWRDAVSTLHRLEQNRSASAQELDAINSDLTLFETIDPKLNEDVELTELLKRLENTESLRNAVSTAHEALSSESDSEDVLTLLAAARKAIEHELGNDASLEGLHSRIQDALYSLREVAADLSGYLASLDGESELSLEAVQDRKAKITTLTRKHGPTLEEVFAWRQAATLRLLELDSSDDRVEALQAEIEVRNQAAQDLAIQIRHRRMAAALDLAIQVNAELAGLAMKDAELVVSVTPADELGAHGADVVAIDLRSYPGAEPRPIGKGASGGELSRIMLAIEVVLAKGASTPTFVFDEVDAGIGGAAAIEVGKRLAKLAQQAQVIVVTHLAQVAAFADHHLSVRKASDSGITESDVKALNLDDRRVELARMLSGLSDSQAAADHALELMSLAKSTRQG